MAMRDSASFQPEQQTLQIWLFAALLFAAGLGLFTRSNGFPFYAHPDEPG